MGGPALLARAEELEADLLVMAVSGAVGCGIASPVASANNPSITTTSPW